jgi:hypothetical protein
VGLAWTVVELVGNSVQLGLAERAEVRALRTPSKMGSSGEAPPADDHKREGHEGFVDVVTDFPADA